MHKTMSTTAIKALIAYAQKMDLPTMAGQADEELNLLLGEISSLRGAAHQMAGRKS